MNDPVTQDRTAARPAELLYSDTSYRNALWVFAAVALAGALLTALIPKAGRIGDAGAAVEDGQTV
jgi:hypothetical protein